MTRVGNLLMGAWMAAAAAGALAGGERQEVPTRTGVTVPVFWQPAASAKATVLLFPGGAGGFGQVEAGRPTGRNYLVRGSGEFVARGYNVAIVGRPSDTPDLGYADRLTDAHLGDIRAVLAAVKGWSPLPVWLVGTSRGTVSVTAAASRGVGEIAGMVLTSAITAADKRGNVPSQQLAAIRVPVLVVHHAKDQCRVTPPGEAPRILSGLTAAPVKKLVIVDGGANPQGDPCEALHWHGFIGMEAEVVDLITGWMDRPVP